jgi:hypothetical protein
MTAETILYLFGFLLVVLIFGIPVYAVMMLIFGAGLLCYMATCVIVALMIVGMVLVVG